nr:hypothetical protein [Candidatus Mycoplasma haematolamae]
MIDSAALDPQGEMYHFEKEVINERYLSRTFTRPRMYWERAFMTTRPLEESVRSSL